jgi:copper chaperone CopZ
MVVETFAVVGMTCGHCVAAVTDEISKLASVQRVEIDLPTGSVTVESATALDRTEVASAVDQAGFEMAG